MSGQTGGRIPESFIESVLAKTDIIVLIQESISLKKNGVNYSACCPFHQEKTPSFTVSQTKQFYHCFGCGAHGDAIGFLMAHQGLDFVAALERLAQRLGLSVPKDPKQAQRLKHKYSLTQVLNECAQFYAHQLKNHDHAQAAVLYLKKRGLSGQIAKDFQLGFAPPGWDNIVKHFGSQPDILPLLIESGMIVQHDSGRYYDRFRERIMFPIRDRQGEVIAFGARVLDQSLPKYLNSPESPIFQKGYCLYGLHEALVHKQKWQQAIVVEGYLDVVALAQMGVNGAVATLGTAISVHQIQTLMAMVSEIIFCFDGDKAGRNAAWKALQLTLGVLTEQIKVRFVFLPQGEDPDSYVRQYGANALGSLIHQGASLSEYFFATLREQITPDSVDNRAQLANLARPMIERIPAGIFKEMMYEQLALMLSSTPQVMRGQKAFRPFFPAQAKKLPKSPPPPPQATAYIAAALLLQMPELFIKLKPKIALLTAVQAPGMALLQAIARHLEQDPALCSATLRDLLVLNQTELSRLSECQTKVALIPIEGVENELMGAILRLEKLAKTQLAGNLLEKAKKEELSLAEKAQLRELLQ